MLPIIIAIILFLILSVYVTVNLISDIVYIIINIALLWVVLLRSYFEIRHKKIIYPYMIGLGITTFLEIFWFEQLQINKVFWTVGFLALVFFFAEILQYIKYIYEKYELKQKFLDYIKNLKKKKKN